MNAAEASAPNRAKCLEAENLDGETSSGHASCASQERPRSARVAAEDARATAAGAAALVVHASLLKTRATADARASTPV